MHTLMEAVAGVYRVVTRSSNYVVDLDLGVLRREPRPGHPDSVLLPREEQITLHKVIDCCVDRRMVLLIDVVLFGITVTVRFTTQAVVAIDPESSPETETAR